MCWLSTWSQLESVHCSFTHFESTESGERIGGVPVIAVKLQATPSSELRTLHLVVDLGTRHYPAMLGGPFLKTTDGEALQKMGATKQLGTGTGGGIEGSEATLAQLQVGKLRGCYLLDGRRGPFCG